MRRSRTNRPLSPWTLLVGASAALVVGVLAAVLLWGFASSERRVSTLAVRGFLNGVTVDATDGAVQVVGGGDRVGVGVERTDRYTFGHEPRVTRSVRRGVLRLRARCPSTVLHGCSTRLRLVVPDNVPVTITTRDGDVRFDGYRGSARVTTGAGDIALSAFCGFSLQARSDSGAIAAAATCPPQSLSLRSRSGSLHAVVPPGRYRVEADSDQRAARVRGLTVQPESPFVIQALSGTGGVLVEGRR